MKNLLLIFVLILIIGCQKDHQSPEEQLVQAIEEKAKNGDRPLNVMVLKSDRLCAKIDCNTEVIESNKTTLTIYSKEEIFMRAPNVYFKLTQWAEAPRVIALGRRGEVLTDDQVEHKCRGN